MIRNIQPLFAEFMFGGLAVAQPIRAALTGNTVSPSVFEIMDVLGREETLGRIDDALGGP